MIKILLIRHALTDPAGEKLSGRTPGITLNKEGLHQVEELVERLKNHPVSAVYSSPLERTLETAVPLADAYHLSCVVSEDFTEIDFGEWTNRTISELINDPVFRRFNSFRSNTRIPGGESLSEAQLRIIKGVEKLQKEHSGQTVAVVSHADMIKLAVAWYAGIHPDMLHRIEISPASVSILEIFDDTARITLLNDTGRIKK